MERFLTQLGSIIKHARIEEGLTQAKLAEKAGISTRYLSDIENKNEIPSLKVFISLILALRDVYKRQVLNVLVLRFRMW